MNGFSRASMMAGMLLVAGLAHAASPPSRFGVDAPELAPPGAAAVGVKTVRLVQAKQADFLSPEAAGGFASKDRVLNVDIWYPAAGAPVPRGGAGITYTAALPSEPPAAPASFSIPGIARRNAKALPGSFPLVIVSHGYSNATVALTWLTENLASKGYVVAAIRHEDPPITDRSKSPAVWLRRPLDIAFVAAQLQSTLATEFHIDAARTALVGYSMGGYGVLTSAGAVLDPAAGAKFPGGLMAPYVRGGVEQASVVVKNLRAVVALAPAGGALGVWGTTGLQAIQAPLMLIAGDQDHTVNYATGARAFFDAATSTTRYLLTFKEGGHAIGLNPAPEGMRSKLWDVDWFEDPVWRKDRINGINAHFITAFLDLYVKSDASRAAYLDVSVTDSDAGQWPSDQAKSYDAYSPAAQGVTVWKGFQRNHAGGLQLLKAEPARH
jgi:predicted dienelactone hydrolase